MTSDLKSAIRQVVPERLWSKLRVWNMRRSVAAFDPHDVTHAYDGERLKIRIADPLGRDWYDHDWHALAEIQLLAQHQLRPGAVVFDLGAHQGVVALMLARHVVPGGKVVAVEANPHNARVARRNVALNPGKTVVIEEAAVTERDGGTVTFNEDLNGAVDDGTGAVGRITVPAVSVDSLARRHGAPSVLFLDVEGYEVKVLEGASAVLARRPDCFIEVHVGCGLETFGGSVPALAAFFPESAYTLHVGHQRHAEFEPYRPDHPWLRERFYLLALAR
jgi:FkbM family methyltransferase